MSPALQIVASFSLTFGVPMALALRELRAMRPHRPGNGGPPGGEPPAPKPRKPLPDCLIPRRLPEGDPRLERALELAE